MTKAEIVVLALCLVWSVATTLVAYFLASSLGGL